MGTKVKPNELLERCIKARYPLIGIISHEEDRVMDIIRDISREKRQVVEWSYTTGMTGLDGVDPSDFEDPNAALKFLSQYDPDATAGDKDSKIRPTLFVFKDLHKIMAEDIRVLRFLREISMRFVSRKHNLILVSPSLGVPSDLEKSITIIDWPLPDMDELTEILSLAEKTAPSSVKVNINGNRDQIVQSMRGLTAMEAENVLRHAMVAQRELSDSVIPFINMEKANIIKKSGVLEYYDINVTMKDVGGLQNLKKYASIKRAAFSSKARLSGVDAPKGLLMVGVPGTGKSLAAKAIAGGVYPLLRMDVGALMGGLVGQSESNMRAALKVAEGVSPCILWVDEIEKAMGGGSGESDGGTSSRVFGTLLTWMQETSAPVYVVATANDVRSLRPELLRRFDDVMWVDLPNAESRAEVLSIHVNKRVPGFTGDAAIMAEIVAKTWGFSGAEIEKVVKSAVETAFFEGVALSAQHLLNASGNIVPVSVTMEPQINELRSWAKNRAISAGPELEKSPAIIASNKAKSNFDLD
jgi:SpoVK/Ycf46/Vps4 family AAA+-type ATPase